MAITDAGKSESCQEPNDPQRHNVTPSFTKICPLIQKLPGGKRQTWVTISILTTESSLSSWQLFSWWNPNINKFPPLDLIMYLVFATLTIQTHTWLVSRNTVLLAKFLRIKLWMLDPDSSIEPSCTKCSGRVTYVAPPSSSATSEIQRQVLCRQ
jgi:hypothetical protein